MRNWRIRCTVVALFAAAAIGCLGYEKPQDKPSPSYKEAPQPHYTEEKGYGWKVDVPVNKPEHVWHVLKVWENKYGMSVFTDKDKDGECDVVLEFEKTGGFTETGSPYVKRMPNKNCEEKEQAIVNEIKYWKERERRRKNNENSSHNTGQDSRHPTPRQGVPIPREGAGTTAATLQTKLGHEPK